MEVINKKIEKDYKKFLENKIIISEDFGFEIQEDKISPFCKPHQKDICIWSLKGGRRAVFASFGLGKSVIQLEIAKQCIDKTGLPFLIVCPLAVAIEFKKDNIKLDTRLELTYITDTETIETYKPQIFITNYERVRMGDIDPSKFCGVSFDEASILRNLKTETTNYVLEHFKNVPYRFVATATPTPNDYIEILNYAVFLGVADRGHLLTRFFNRDSEHAGHLTLKPNKKKEFWMWVATWAVFISKPSDLGYSDEGYDLPELNIIEHCVNTDNKESYINKDGKLVMFKDISKSLPDVSREKRESIAARCDKAFDVALDYKSAIIWHSLEPEREYLEKLFKEKRSEAVYGSQKNHVKEKLLMGFAEGEYDYLLTKSRIAGSGCNFQEHCSTVIFAGIDYKFNDFIQSIHRVLRFGQTKKVDCHIIFTAAEYEVLKVLYKKWDNHKTQLIIMTNLVKEFGLNKDVIEMQMARQLFNKEKKVIIGNAELHNNDTVIMHQQMADNSTDMILTSIPFGDHYEYSENYNDFGHNDGNEEFFKQMDFLTPNLLRTLKPGRVAAIHVKDRIRYSHQNGTCFTTISDFSGQTVSHFIKHGFYLMGKITVTTDVVRENNQTYRLGHTEQCKDGSKMGVGLPEYILLFRKAPTSTNNAYADKTVLKGRSQNDLFCINCKKLVDMTNSEKTIVINEIVCCKGCDKSDFEQLDELYPLNNWQLDAHAYWKSSGDRFLSAPELARFEMKTVYNQWKAYDEKTIYSFQEHLRVCDDLFENGRLSKLFMTIPPTSNNDLVWTDINRMNTLNAKQANNKNEKHICPLQIDIIKRLLKRFTSLGEKVDDPFGGLFSTPYVAMEMGRKSISAELNPDYFKDGIFYMNAMNHKMNIPTLFDMLNDKN